MTFDGTSVTLAGRLINSYTSLASSPAKVFTGTWFTGGTATTTKPHLLIEPSGATSTAWSTSGTGLGVNAASGFTGRLLDLQLNGTSNFSVDSTGRLLSGTGSARTNTNPVGFSDPVTFNLQHEGTSASAGLSIVRNSNNANGSYWALGKTRATAVGGNTAVLAGDTLGVLSFLGADGTNLVPAASISVMVDGFAGTNDMPGRLVFSTTLDNSPFAVTERLRITNDGVIAYNQPAPTSKSAAATLTIAELKTAIVQYTGAADTLTLPTGTLMDGGFSNPYTNMTFEWSVINTGSGTVTIDAGVDHTIVGHATVAAGDSGRFASRRTAANTFVSYRLS
jgi:hypothetical protein